MGGRYMGLLFGGQAIEISLPRSFFFLSFLPAEALVVPREGNSHKQRSI